MKVSYEDIQVSPEMYSLCSTKFVNKLDGGLNANSGLEGKNTLEDLLVNISLHLFLVGGCMCTMNSSATLPDRSLMECGKTGNKKMFSIFSLQNNASN